MSGACERLLGRAAGEWAAALLRGEAWLDRGAPDRFVGLCDEARLLAALRRMPTQWQAAPPFGALVTDPLGDGLTFTEVVAVDEIEAWLARGHTICADDVSGFDAGLAAVAEALVRDLGCAGGRFNAYLSPAGARTPMHFDTRVSTTLQLTGRKRWRYQRTAAAPNPSANGQIDRFGDTQWMAPVVDREPPPRPSGLEVVELGPGDLLCVPAGAWHEVSALERGLALNLSLRVG